MPNEIKSVDDLKAKIAELNRLLIKAYIDLSIAQTQLAEVQLKLIEAQERNRKLDWLLTEAVERG